MLTWLCILLARACVIFLACFGATVIAAVIVSKRVRRELHAVGILCDQITRIGEDSEQRIASIKCDCKCDDDTPLVVNFRPTSELSKPANVSGKAVAHASR